MRPLSNLSPKRREANTDIQSLSHSSNLSEYGSIASLPFVRGFTGVCMASIPKKMYRNTELLIGQAFLPNREKDVRRTG
ncbi:MAG: hypothetical protein NT023_16620 [Armatimonadetes bacterium]|nr:hypothetical protein [Armatimonadota bacterium]